MEQGSSTMGTREENNRQPQNLLSLGKLIGRELRKEKTDKPNVRFGSSFQSRKGEDCFFIKTDCLKNPENPSTVFSVFAVFDGHNGNTAAIYCKDNLLNYVMEAIPSGLSEDEWTKVLPRALVAGFVKADKEFQKTGLTSGTTATFVIVDDWTVTVACVGDSRCVLDTQGGQVLDLSVDHRFDDNEEEQERVKASGGEVSRLNMYHGSSAGPLRCWPGGLCLSRSIGDMDVGAFISPIPHVKQVKLSKSGGRLIIASDGVWDILTSEIAAQNCHGVAAELAAQQVVKATLKKKGLRDDTTCVVVDIIPPEKSVLTLDPLKKLNKCPVCCFKKSSQNGSSKVSMVEELYEEGSAVLAERLGDDDYQMRYLLN